MRSVLLAVGAALVMTGAFEPFGWSLLVFPGVIGFLYSVWIARSGWWATAAGAAFGIVHYATLFPWVGELGTVALVPLTLSQAIFPTLFAPILHRFRGWVPWQWAVVATGLWGLMDFLRENVPFGGFPWGFAGYPLGSFEAVRDVTGFVGVSGWSVIVVAVCASVVAGLGSEWRWWMLAAPGIAAALVVAGVIIDDQRQGPSVEVAIVQGSSPCPGERCSGQRRAIYERHLELTRSIDPGSVDLVVWPEGSTGFNADPGLDPEIRDAMGAEARRIGAPLLAGGDRPISDTEWVNVNVVFDADGEIVGEYQKQHPVPFGEYVPFRSFFDFIPDLERVPRDMVRGDGPVIFDEGFGPFGSIISFESVFSRYGRESVLAGAEVLVLATSQASYPFSSASDQLIAMTRMRSAELGVDLVHAAVTGRSAFLVDGGDIQGITDLVDSEILAGTVRLRDAEPTLYVRLGDWVRWLSIAAATVVVAAPIARRQS